MVRFLAIDFNQIPAAVVVARVHREKPIEIVSVGEISSGEIDSTDEQDPPQAELNVELPDGGIDRAFAIVGNSELVYTSIDLPFKDPKKIAQVVPMQLQDSLPFDVSECVMDTSVMDVGGGPDTKRSYRILAALNTTKSVESSLLTMSSVGIDPVKLSTHASALAELYQAACENSGEGHQQEKMVSLVNIQPTFVALVILLEGNPCFYREWNCAGDESLSSTISEIQASIASAEVSFDIDCEAVYALGSNDALKYSRERLPYNVKMLNLEGIVENHTETTLALDKYCWAIGLAVREKLQTTLPISTFDFRKGPYAYQRAWVSFWDAIADEMTWVILAVVFLLGFIGAKWWSVHHELAVIEREIANISKQSSSLEPIPKRGEIQFFESAIEERENQLLEMGSLASLSPLESLRLLSTTISPNVAVEVESITIGFSRILLRGTVQDTPTLGTLETSLKAPSKQFCSVKVNPSGRESGSSRPRFSAEIEVCE